MNDPTWSFYCAANKLTVLNIACNLPHNQKSFQEVYGEVEGKTLWNQFLSRYTNVTGFDFYYYPGQETDFVPLWKMEGLTPADITPFTIDQYNAYDQHRRVGTPYSGPMPVPPPKAVVCSAQSTADFVNAFIQIYADPYDAGPITTIGVLWGWMNPVLQRTGMPELEYLYYTLGISRKLAYEYAQTSAASVPTASWNESPWFLEVYNILQTIFGGTGSLTSSQQDMQMVQSLVTQDMNAHALVTMMKSPTPPTPDMLTVYTLMDVVNRWSAIMAGGLVSNEDAFVEFMNSAQKLFDGAEDIVVRQPDKIQYNVLPATFNLISNGLYGKNDLVTVETVCTAVDMSELQLKSS